MLNLQNLDTHRFHVLASAKTSPSIGTSFAPPENTTADPKKPKDGGGAAEAVPKSEFKRAGAVHRSGPLVHESAVGKPGFVKHTYTKERNLGIGLKKGNGNCLVKKVPTKCSPKRVSYGGCIPAILKALDEFEDLDEALRPWEERLNNKERSIILKEQSNWERALQIFEWFKVKGWCELNVIHYNIMLRILGKAREWSLVQSLWDEMNVRGISPINSTYGTLIDVYSKGGLKEDSLFWLERMNENGMEPDEVTMGIVVQLYKKAGEFQKAENFFKKWSSSKSVKYQGMNTTSNPISKRSLNSHTTLSSHTYNTLIDTYGKAGKLLEASRTFAKMLKEGVAPTTVTFNTMIHICGNQGQLKEVASLMKKMEEMRCYPDTRTYNILISLHTKHDDINMATNYFRKMKRARLKPDTVSYRTLLYAYSIRHMVQEAEELVLEMDERGLEIDEFTQSSLTRMYIEAGLIEKSWIWFRRFHSLGNMSSECYSANIDAYGERGWILEAEKVFICCQEEKNLTVLECNVMIKAYGVVKYYDKACNLFDSMENDGVVPDKCTYSSLIQILSSADMAHQANLYLKKMQDAGLINDCIPYSVVISSFAKLGNLEMVECLYNEMISFGMNPDVIVYGVLINAFADSGSVKKAIGYVNAMRKAGLPGNTVIYNSLIKLYTKVGYLKEAQETYDLLKLSNDGPDIYSSNCMIDLYSERSMVLEAEEIFESLKSKKEANEFTYAMMLCLYKKIGRFSEAICIAREMRELSLLKDLLSYNNVLGLYAIDGRFKEAIGILKEMIGSSIEPDDCTFKLLGVVLVKCGVSKQGVSNLEVMAKKDAQNALLTWMSTLSSVVGVNGYD